MVVKRAKKAPARKAAKRTTKKAPARKAAKRTTKKAPARKAAKRTTKKAPRFDHRPAPKPSARTRVDSQALLPELAACEYIVEAHQQADMLLREFTRSIDRKHLSEAARIECNAFRRLAKDESFWKIMLSRPAAELIAGHYDPGPEREFQKVEVELLVAGGWSREQAEDLVSDLILAAHEARAAESNNLNSIQVVRTRIAHLAASICDVADNLSEAAPVQLSAAPSVRRKLSRLSRLVQSAGAIVPGIHVLGGAAAIVVDGISPLVGHHNQDSIHHGWQLMQHPG
jgi:hypothetical protein